MSEIDNITVSITDSVDNIDINYVTQVDNITLNLGTGAFVDSVNGLIGNVNLTSASTLVLTYTASGTYNHVFYHNLNYQNPIINIFNLNNELVFSDISFDSSTHATIKSLQDLTGYKVVAQR